MNEQQCFDIENANNKKSEFFLDLEQQRAKALQNINAKRNIQAINYRQLSKIKTHLKKQIKNMLNQGLRE